MPSLGTYMFIPPQCIRIKSRRMTIPFPGGMLTLPVSVLLSETKWRLGFHSLTNQPLSGQVINATIIRCIRQIRFVRFNKTVRPLSWPSDKQYEICEFACLKCITIPRGNLLWVCGNGKHSAQIMVSYRFHKSRQILKNNHFSIATR